MRVSTLRAVDRWAGVPCCFGLTLVRRCRDWWPAGRRRVASSPQRILIVKLAEQGATVLAYAAIRRAVQQVGRDNVYFLVFQENRFILDVMELIPAANVIAIPTEGAGRFARGLLQALSRVRRLRPDAAVDFEFFARGSAVLTYLSGASQRVGLHACQDGAPYRGDLMTHRLRYDPQGHTSRLYLEMIEALAPPGSVAEGMEPGAGPGPQLPALEQELPPLFRPTVEEIEQLRSVIRQEAHADDVSPLVLLNPNASDLLPMRRWPAGRYVALARRLLDQSPHGRVAFTGAPAEQQAAARLVAEVDSPRCFSLAGKTSLRELLVLYGLADVLVTNDSGPAHFAALTPIQVITLFGPESPARFGSRSPRAWILWKDLACSPCVSALNNRFSLCRDAQCMRQISVDEVHGLVVEALARGGQ